MIYDPPVSNFAHYYGRRDKRRHVMVWKVVYRSKGRGRRKKAKWVLR
jgi:hypothetical protein